MEISEVRRANVRALIEKYGASKLATRLGYRNPSFLSQQAGPNPTREVTERTARAFEQKLGLPAGTLDVPPDQEARPADVSTRVIADVIRLVGTIIQNENVQMPPPQRFADLVSLAVVDTMEHGGVPREQHIRSVVRLLKD